LTDATGQFQRAAGQLSACTGIAEQARGAIDQMSMSVANATATSRWTVEELTHQLGGECIRAVCLLCGAALLLGVLGGMAFELWRGVGVAVVPQAIAVPEQVAAPASSVQSTPKKPTPETPRTRRRESPATSGPASKPPPGTVMEQGSNSDGTAKSPDDAKP
jgi:hypothetical protein